MFTSDDARNSDNNDLDERIKYAVKNNRSGNGATIRIYCDDWFAHRIHYELSARGFKNIHVPDFVLKTDVYFEW